MAGRKNETPPRKEPTFRNDAFKDALSKLKATPQAPTNAPTQARPQPAPPRPPPKATRATSHEKDDALFLMAMEDVPRMTRDEEGPAAPPPVSAQRTQEDAEALAQLAELVAADDALEISSTARSFEGLARGVDPSLLGALRRGDFRIEAQAELHDVGSEPFLQALERLLVDSRRRGLRAVRVIPGRGLPTQDPIPFLTSRLTDRLCRGRLARLVLAFGVMTPNAARPLAIDFVLRR